MNISDTKPKKEKITLQEVLESPSLREQFSSFLKNEFADETLLFWIEVNSFLESDLSKLSADKVIASCKKLYEKFLKPDAELEVNIPGKTVKQLKEAIESRQERAATTALTRCRLDAQQLLQSDAFPRWLPSARIEKQHHRHKNKDEKTGATKLHKSPEAAKQRAVTVKRKSPKSASSDDFAPFCTHSTPPSLAEYLSNGSESFRRWLADRNHPQEKLLGFWDSIEGFIACDSPDDAHSRAHLIYARYLDHDRSSEVYVSAQNCAEIAEAIGSREMDKLHALLSAAQTRAFDVLQSSTYAEFVRTNGPWSAETQLPHSCNADVVRTAESAAARRAQYRVCESHDSIAPQQCAALRTTHVTFESFLRERGKYASLAFFQEAKEFKEAKLSAQERRETGKALFTKYFTTVESENYIQLPNDVRQKLSITLFLKKDNSLIIPELFDEASSWCKANFIIPLFDTWRTDDGNRQLLLIESQPENQSTQQEREKGFKRTNSSKTLEEPISRRTRSTLTVSETFINYKKHQKQNDTQRSECKEHREQKESLGAEERKSRKERKEKKEKEKDAKKKYVKKGEQKTPEQKVHKQKKDKHEKTEKKKQKE